MKNVVCWKRALRLVFDLLFPVSCIGCGQADTWLCQKCLTEIKSYSGKKLSLAGIDEIDVAASYENKLVQKAIHLLKYKSVSALSDPLATLVQRSIAIDPDCLLIPVPLHPRRERQRGFNQSTLICQTITKNIKVNLRTDILIRRRYSKPQMKLDREERLQNLKGAFELSESEAVTNRNIILIDDVLTTGKTLSECAKVLRTGHPRSITALVVAHGK
ncbi:ComF family protein [Patescibacteria group bacterium]